MLCTGIRSNKRGFTLIELLVVIAIIAILAAILFPIFTAAKKRANWSTCGSNLKQIALAVSQYASDNVGKLPIVYQDSFKLMSNGCVKGLLPYVRNKRMFQCPSGATCPLCWDETVTPRWRKEVDYRFNPAMATNPAFDDSTAPQVPKSLDQCRYSRIFYISQDRHSYHHLATSDQGSAAGTMLTVMADGHIASNVHPYASQWIDGNTRLKYEHWDFPNCHRYFDPAVASQYP